MKFPTLGLLQFNMFFSTALYSKKLPRLHFFILLRAPDSYDLINCYVRVFSVLFKSEYIVCAGFHLSIKNIGVPAVDVHNFSEIVFHYKRLHSLHLSVFMYQIGSAESGSFPTLCMKDTKPKLIHQSRVLSAVTRFRKGSIVLSLPPACPRFMILKSKVLNLLSPHSYNLINGYMCQFSFTFEGEYIICTGFYSSPENIWPTTVNIYGTFEVVLYDKRLHHIC